MAGKVVRGSGEKGKGSLEDGRKAKFKVEECSVDCIECGGLG